MIKKLYLLLPLMFWLGFVLAHDTNLRLTPDKIDKALTFAEQLQRNYAGASKLPANALAIDWWEWLTTLAQQDRDFLMTLQEAGYGTDAEGAYGAWQHILQHLSETYDAIFLNIDMSHFDNVIDDLDMSQSSVEDESYIVSLLSVRGDTKEMFGPFIDRFDVLLSEARSLELFPSRYWIGKL